MDVQLTLRQSIHELESAQENLSEAELIGVSEARLGVLRARVRQAQRAVDALEIATHFKVSP